MAKKVKALVLVSGGIDSTTCLAMAIDKFGSEVMALTASYGQKHTKEIDYAKAVCEYYGIEQQVADLSEVFKLSNCSLLTHSTEELDHSSYAQQLEALGGEGTVATYVPFRNGLFLAYAAAVAISVGAEVIYYGAHADDAAGRAYPDCTPEFEQAMHKAIFEGSGRIVDMEAPLLNMNKAEVVEMGLSLDAPYELTWSCYEGGERPCGTCGTCIDRAKAFDDNGIFDPAQLLY